MATRTTNPLQFQQNLVGSIQTQSGPVKAATFGEWQSGKIGPGIIGTDAWVESMKALKRQQGPTAAERTPGVVDRYGRWWKTGPTPGFQTWEDLLGPQPRLRTPEEVASEWADIRVERDPAMQKIRSDLMESYKEGQKITAPSFKEMYDFYKNKALPTMTSAMEKTQAQLDPDAIRQRLSGYDAGYADEMRALLDEYRKANAATAGRQNKISEQQWKEFQDYQDWLKNAGEARARSAAKLGISRYLLGAGGIDSGGGAPAAGGAAYRFGESAYAATMLPYMQRASELGLQLRAAQSGLAGEQAAREAARYSYAAPVIGNIYERQAGTERYINSLASQLGNMTIAQAEQILRSMALPDEMISRILAAKSANAAALGELDKYGTYRGLGYLVEQPVVPQEQPINQYNIYNPNRNYPDLGGVVAEIRAMKDEIQRQQQQNAQQPLPQYEYPVNTNTGVPQAGYPQAGYPQGNVPTQRYVQQPQRR